MEYNTTRGNLVMAEYGRNLQKMVDHICEIPDRIERTKAAYALVTSMEQLSPAQKEFADFRHKLWDHLHIISGFRLDVDSPYPIPAPEEVALKPQPVGYVETNFRYRHYGRYLQRMIDYVIEQGEHPDRDSMIEVVANNLKMAYLAWNRDTVTDDVIDLQLQEISKGKLSLGNIRLKPSSELLQIVKQQQKLQPLKKGKPKKKRK